MLRDLGVNDKITDAALLRLPNLTSLRLQGSNTLISDRSVSLLTNLTSLHVAEESNQVAAAAILSLPNLRQLGLGGSNVIRDEHLVQLSNLDTLFLSFNYTITSESVTTLSNLVELDIIYSSVPVSCLHVLPRLRKLRIGGQKGKQPYTGLEKLTALTDLNASSVAELTDELLFPFTSLQVLSALKTNITNRSVSRLVNLRVLTCPVSITNAGISTLVNLEELIVPENTPITTAGLKPLKFLRVVRGKVAEVRGGRGGSRNDRKHSF